MNAQTTAASLIDTVVAAEPDHLAVKGTDGTLTYGELSVRADEAATRLLELGVKPGDLVGLCLERSASLVVGALADLPGRRRLRGDRSRLSRRAAAVDARRLRRRRRGHRHRRPPRGSATPRRPVVLSRAAWSTPDADRAPAPRPSCRPAPRPGRPRLRRLHLGLDRAAQGGDGRAREPGQPGRLAPRAPSTLRPRGPLHPDRQPRLRRRGVGDLAQPGRRRRRSTSSPRRCASTRSACATGSCAEGITVTFLPTAVAEAVIGLRWPERRPRCATC